jgi:hypothetical protein
MMLPVPTPTVVHGTVVLSVTTAAVAIAVTVLVKVAAIFQCEYIVIC